jgi:hypothetical protein
VQARSGEKAARRSAQEATQSLRIASKGVDDLLTEGALSGEPALWEGVMLREVVRVNQALQSVNQLGNFWELVNEYRRASRELSESRDQNPA